MYQIIQTFLDLYKLCLAIKLTCPRIEVKLSTCEPPRSLIIEGFPSSHSCARPDAESHVAQMDCHWFSLYSCASNLPLTCWTWNSISSRAPVLNSRKALLWELVARENSEWVRLRSVMDLQALNETRRRVKYDAFIIRDKENLFKHFALKTLPETDSCSTKSLFWCCQCYMSCIGVFWEDQHFTTHIYKKKKKEKS